MPLTDTVQRAAPIALSILDDSRVTGAAFAATRPTGSGEATA